MALSALIFSVQLVVACFANLIFAHKVLIITPTLTNSHIMLNYRIGELLASAGHDITIYRPQYNPDAMAGESNLTKEIRYSAIKNVDFYRAARKAMQTYVYNASSPYNMSMVKVWNQLARNGCKEQITDKRLMEKLKKENFDLAIVHNYDMCPMGIVHVLKIPSFIWLSCGVLMDYMATAIGLPSPPSYVPSLVADSTDRMNFWERTKNSLSVAAMNIMIPYFVSRPMTQVFREAFGPQFPDLLEVAGKAPLVFVNSEELIDFPRPVFHKVVYIGGLGLNEKRTDNISKKWQQIMDTSHGGAVLISFGSVAHGSDMPPHWKRAFLSIFSKFPKVTFIWKYETPYPEVEALGNVHISSWLPQRALLSHPKMRVFVTHCGLNSMMEAAYAGVPMLAIPLQGDQLPTRHRAERNGIALGINKADLSDETIHSKLQELLTNRTYKSASKRLSSMLKKKPIKSEELVRNWVEFLGEFQKLENLAVAGGDMSFLQYFLVDVMAGISVFGLFSAYIVYRVCYCYYWWCFQTYFTK